MPAEPVLNRVRQVLSRAPEALAAFERLHARSHNPPPQRLHEVVCLARNAAAARHLAPIAAAGGWPLIGPDQCGGLAGALVVVAFASDEGTAMRNGARGTVLCEHGAGQSYCDAALPKHSVWRGGRGHGYGRMMLLAPGPLLARRHRQAHPRVPVVRIGCPMLDAWHGKAVVRRQGKPLVCISTHWDCRTLPELRSAWPWVRDRLAALAGCADIELVGHFHPYEFHAGTLHARLRDYAAHGIRVLHTWEEVLAAADVYVADNTSTLYEFAATGRPVVCLSPPWYRKSARHGLRFGAHAPGLQVADLDALLPTIISAAADPEHAQQQRRRAVRAAYGVLDGQASQRAVAAIRTLL